MIDISGLNKVEVLRALYANAKPLGMGMLHFIPGPLPVDEAKELLAYDPRYMDFDYLKGRLMKVNITGDSFEERLYDRDNGNGAAARAIATLRK